VFSVQLQVIKIHPARYQLLFCLVAVSL